MQGCGGHVIVGSSGEASVVAEFDILYHEMISLHNLLTDLVKDDPMNHLENVVHHSLGGKKGPNFNSHVSKLLTYVKNHKTPYADINSAVPLHNLFTQISVPQPVATRILNVLSNGSKGYEAFRKERFVEKEKKLFNRITPVKLPKFQTSPSGNNKVSEKSQAKDSKALPKSNLMELSTAKQHQEVDMARGLSQSDLLSHDLFPDSVIFDGDFCTKTSNKAGVVTEMESVLSEIDKTFVRVDNMLTEVIVDFMSSVRQFVAGSSGTWVN